jgi:glycosyltransferase involved in cell wall biosynthesis
MSEDGLPSLLLVSFRYPPETGAAATRLDALTTRRAEVGHDITVLTPTPDYPDGEFYDGYDNGWLRREQRDGVDVVMTKSIPAAPGDHLVRRVLKYLWFTIVAVVVSVCWLDRRDLVLATSPQPFAGLAGLVTARIRGVPFVFEIRDLWPESLVAMGEIDTPIMVRMLDELTDFLYANADRVSVVAPGMKEVVVENGANSEDVWLHTNGIDHELFAPADAQAVDEQALFEEHFVLSYVGTVGKAQGLEVVLDVADYLQRQDEYSEVRFVFIGFGSRYDALAAGAERRGLDNIVFLGRKPNSEIPDYLFASDVAFIHTAGEAAFETMIPMKLYEALAAGLPVVLGAEGDAVEILHRANAGISVTPGDASAISEAVETLYADHDLRHQYGQDGREYVVENHSWDAIATAYSEKFRTLCE